MALSLIHISAHLLLNENCTVTVAHSRTRGLASLCRSADILVAAVGKPEFITRDFIKPGAIIIDVGINRTPDGLNGDVCFSEAIETASYITPVSYTHLDVYKRQAPHPR